MKRILCGTILVEAIAALAFVSRADEPTRNGVVERPQSNGGTVAAFVQRYCTDCHNEADKTAKLALDTVGAEPLARETVVWERVIRRLASRQMPPVDMPRPDESEYEAAVAAIATILDQSAIERPKPGRTETFRRLNRTEYRNAIRDLLSLDVDVDSLLPADESSHGFDNVTVADLSPTLLDRYITAAEKISSLAVGTSGRAPGGDTFRVRPDVTQEKHVEGLPIGTRGGLLILYTFPVDGEYEVQVRLTRDRNEEVEGLTRPHEMEVLLDREQVATFIVKPPADKNFAAIDANLKTRIAVQAGPHKLGVTFVEDSSSLLETKRQPYEAHFNMHRHPRLSPAIYQVSITGPYRATGSSDTPSRQRIFVCEPAGPEVEDDCARRIIATLMRRAYRRPVTDADFDHPMQFYQEARADGGSFDAAIESALSSILVSPHFLFRIEQDPPNVLPGTAYRISDIELASRMSFFLWSSIPDDELLDLAIAGELRRPDVFDQQVRRMLDDERSRSLVTNFADQWLHLRNLDSITPDLRQFPDFDDNLRQAFRQETELLFESVLREDRSILHLLQSDYTFLNERLAKHYGIPHIYGSRFRRVALDADDARGGLLRHGSILTVTSYATRTSPVIRGHWILANVLGNPPPPPPANVPALKDNTVSSNLSVRERLAEHRANAACASCHNLMDPVGFALENFDAVGRWREFEEGRPIDASGGLPDGSLFDGVDGLEQALLQRPELFVGTMAEKLLTYALGRVTDYNDGPAIRKIVRDAKAEDYRFSSLIVGIATSVPFQMRTAE